jgi:putative N6-adenine-specific DNA methylase
MKYLAKTLFGLEEVLSKELISIGASEVTRLNRAVSFTGDFEMLYKTNFCLRTALSILMPVAEFRIRSADELINNSMKIRWDKYLDPDRTFSIVPVINSPLFKHSGYAGLVLKDTIADWFRSRTGRRPSVNTTDPDIVINLHVSNNMVNVSIDSSVIPLYKRGYRKEQGAAPMNEVLAAGIILSSGWDGNSPLIDPMCGSGTIPVEAALIASHIPPGRFRKSFGFEKWKDFDPGLFDKVKAGCESGIQIPSIRISGSDISDISVTQSKTNVESAGLSDIVDIRKCDFRDLKPEESNGYIVMNPPYGQRIRPSDMEELYSMIGSTLKHNFTGFTALMITSDRDSLKYVGLRPSWKSNLYNGSLECILVRYELYQGSKKRGH